MVGLDHTRLTRWAHSLGVKREEFVPLVWAFVYFFCLLCGYSILRPVRDEMAIEGGLKHLPWMMTATFLTMLAATPLFGWLSARCSRYRLLLTVYAFFIVNLLAFYALMMSHLYPEWVARSFFVWLSVMNLFIVSVFWSFMADLFTPEQGARLFGVIAAGGSSGALVGPLITTGLTFIVPVPVLMLASMLFLTLCLGCVYRLDRWGREQSAHHQSRPGDPLRGSFLAGIRLTMSSPYLLGICGYLAFLTMTATFLYLEQTRLVSEYLDQPEARTRLFSSLDFTTGLLTWLTQMFVDQTRHQPVWSGRALTVSSSDQLDRVSRYRAVADSRGLRCLFCVASGGGVCVIQTCTRGSLYRCQPRREIQSEEFHRHGHLTRRRCLDGVAGHRNQSLGCHHGPHCVGVRATHDCLGLAGYRAGPRGKASVGIYRIFDDREFSPYRMSRYRLFSPSFG